MNQRSPPPAAIPSVCYHEARLDPTAWQPLAPEFERADRPHRAAAILHKLQILQLLKTDPRHFVDQAKSIAAAIGHDPIIR